MPSSHPTCSNPANSAPVPDEAAVCDTCGAFGAHQWADISLCVACYAAKGSCCAESPADYKRPALAD